MSSSAMANSHSSSSTVRKISTAQNQLTCSDCLGAITGKAMKAGAKFWHDHHFNCSDCGLRLRDTKVFQKDGRLFCEPDYKAKFVPRCAFCSGFILQDCIRALDQTWHPEHFNCRKCSSGFGKDQGFHEKDGFPYCKSCYVDLACSKCAGCQRPITDKAIKAMNKDWHVDCFVCKTCQQSFEGQKTFFCVDGFPVCAACTESENAEDEEDEEEG